MIRNDCDAYYTMMQDLINYIDHVFEFLIWRRPTKRPHNLIHFQTSYNYQYIRLSRVREAPHSHETNIQGFPNNCHKIFFHIEIFRHLSEFFLPNWASSVPESNQNSMLLSTMLFLLFSTSLVSPPASQAWCSRATCQRRRKSRDTLPASQTGDSLQAFWKINFFTRKVLREKYFLLTFLPMVSLSRSSSDILSKSSSILLVLIKTCLNMIHVLWKSSQAMLVQNYQQLTHSHW